MLVARPRLLVATSRRHDANPNRFFYIRFRRRIRRARQSGLCCCCYLKHTYRSSMVDSRLDDEDGDIVPVLAAKDNSDSANVVAICYHYSTVASSVF